MFEKQYLRRYRHLLLRNVANICFLLNLEFHEEDAVTAVELFRENL